MPKKREYDRPGHFLSEEESYTDERKAWGIAHSLQSDVGYLLDEMNSKQFVIPKHALDMMLKHIHRDLDDIKVLLSNFKEVI